MLLLLALLAPAASQQRRPHIIVVLADDLGAGDVATPRLERLAREGTRFASYYSASPICSPSRAGLLTGAFPARRRLTSYLQTKAGNRGCEQADFLDPQSPTLPRLLRGAGYATAHVGKWHLGGGRDVKDAPKFAAYGYDESAGTWESPEPHPDLTASNWIWSPKDPVKRWERTAWMVDRALDFLRRTSAARPCFVNLWTDDLHDPYVPAADAAKGDTPENFRRVRDEFDRQIGRLLDGLKELGIENETLVVFTSDNGARPTFEGVRSAGLRAGKLSLYEGGIRVPFLARWPGRIPAGRVDEETVLGAVDLLPTLAALAGVEAPKDVDGEDLSKAFLGTSTPRARPLFWEYGRNEKWFKYPAEAGERSPNVAIREGRWKLLVQDDGSRAELYDVVADPGEKADVAAANPEVVDRLKARALEWRRSLP